MTQEALKLALTALEINLTLLEKITPYKGQEDFLSDAIAITQNTTTFIKKALAQEQEPVAWRTFDGEGGYDYRSYEDNESYADDWNKRNPKHVGWVDELYTHSPQPEQEPWCMKMNGCKTKCKDCPDEPPDICCQQYDTCLKPCTPRGVHLAQRTWVGLTDDEMEATFIECGGKWNGDFWKIEDADFHPFLRTIEAKLKQKNGFAEEKNT